MKVELDSKVHSDLLEIMEYYEDEAGTDVAADFYVEFHTFARRAADSPYSYAKYGDFRRVNLRRFPHHFLYEITDHSSIRVVLVRHDRRHPDFGLKR